MKKKTQEEQKMTTLVEDKSKALPKSNQTDKLENTPKTKTAKPTQAQTVGEVLQQARQKKHKEIDAIAAQLCIRPRYLEALEMSNYQDFPGQTYALGFLRTYANYLGLDADSLMNQYRVERGGVKPEKLEMPIAERQVLFPSLKYILLSVAIVLFVWVFWYLLTYSDTSVDALPEAMNEAIAEEQIVDVSTPAATMEAQVLGASGDEASAPVIDAVQSSSVAEAVSEHQKAAPLVEVVATDDAWVEIVQDDELIFSRTMKKGEKYQVPDNAENIYLKTGNAGGIEIYVDGQKTKSLGDVGVVRSNVSLSAQSLKTR